LNLPDGAETGFQFTDTDEFGDTFSIHLYGAGRGGWFVQGKKEPALRSAFKLADALGVSTEALRDGPAVPQDADAGKAGRPPGQKPATRRRNGSAKGKGRGKGES
jgi:hypothetical protein